MRSLFFGLSTALILIALPAWAADEKKGEAKPGEEKTESGLPKVVGGVGKTDKTGKSVADKTPADERIAKILAGLEPKAAPAKADPMKTAPMIDPAVQILATFNALDQDGSGTVSWMEFRELGGNIDRLREIFDHLDNNNDGRINGQEARKGIEYLTNIMNGKNGTGGNRPDGGGNNNGGNNNQPNPVIVAQTQAIFAQLDANGNGRISMREAGDNAAAKQAFALGDTNQDKELTFEELYNYFLQQAQAAQPAGFVPGKLNKK